MLCDPIAKKRRHALQDQIQRLPDLAKASIFCFLALGDHFRLGRCSWWTQKYGGLAYKEVATSRPCVWDKQVLIRAEGLCEADNLRFFKRMATSIKTSDLSISRCQRMGREDTALLTNMPLQHLDIHATSTRLDLCFLLSLPKLKTLNLSGGNKLQGTDLGNLSGLRGLTKLVLNNQHFQDATFVSTIVDCCPMLTHLDLSNALRYTVQMTPRDQDLACLTELTELQFLDVSYCAVNTLSFVPGNGSKLKFLGIHTCGPISDTALAPLKNTDLGGIKIACNAFIAGDVGFSFMRHMKLTELRLYCMESLVDGAFLHVSHMTSLRLLQLSTTSVTCYALQAVKHLPNLEEVDLHMCQNIRDLSVLRDIMSLCILRIASMDNVDWYTINNISVKCLFTVLVCRARPGLQVLLANRRHRLTDEMRVTANVVEDPTVTYADDEWNSLSADLCFDPEA